MDAQGRLYADRRYIKNAKTLYPRDRNVSVRGSCRSAVAVRCLVVSASVMPCQLTPARVAGRFALMLSCPVVSSNAYA
jgi:hypothetical protein